MKPEQPKWGTCAGCRWIIDNRPEWRPGWPGKICIRAPHYAATDGDVDTCGEWEPPEGKVCVNCAHSRDMDGHLIACEIRYEERPSMPLNHQRHQLDTCTAWRWVGEG